MVREEIEAAAAERPSALASRYAGKTVLAIGAHPDDMEIGIGGTLARLNAAGANVLMAIVSVPSDYERRVSEAKSAARILGCDLRFLLNGRSCRVEDLKTYELVRILDSLVAEVQPAALLAHGSADYHRDHVLVHNAAMSTQRLNYFDFFCYYPTNCRPVPISFLPRVYVDVSETMNRKIDAISAHASQFGSRGLGVDVYRETARAQGRLVGVEYAEGLDVVRMLLG